MGRGTLIFCIFVLFLICPSAYGIRDGVILRDKAITVRWFVKSFQGKWVQIPDTEVKFAKRVLDYSKIWADKLLTDKFNPYKVTVRTERKMFLGLGSSPDKLITAFENREMKKQITIIETKQEFVITCETVGKSENNLTKNSKEALSQIQSDFMPMLSEKAGEVVRNVIKVSLEKSKVVELKGTEPLILSHSDITMNAMKNWYDRVNFFWFENRLFIEFLKTYHGKAPLFSPGFDWYPKGLRVKLGVSR